MNLRRRVYLIAAAILMLGTTAEAANRSGPDIPIRFESIEITEHFVPFFADMYGDDDAKQVLKWEIEEGYKPYVAVHVLRHRNGCEVIIASLRSRLYCGSHGCPLRVILNGGNDAWRGLVDDSDAMMSADGYRFRFSVKGANGWEHVIVKLQKNSHMPPCPPSEKCRK